MDAFVSSRGTSVKDIEKVHAHKWNTIMRKELKVTAWLTKSSSASVGPEAKKCGNFRRSQKSLSVTEVVRLFIVLTTVRLHG
jgi:hypothetical protein